MIKRFGGWWFPLVLALALGGVSFWLDRISQLETADTPLDPHEPQYQIFGIRGRRFAADGSPPAAFKLIASPSTPKPKPPTPKIW